MACKTSYEMHHNFPKLADEAGFTFNTHRPRIRIDWSKIRLIDVENLIRERKFVVIEQHVNDILDCVLESEFDVRILDEGVMKMFRLAQLAVEYQQFCRHYLDRSVHVLREEITTLAQELDSTKKELREREEEIRKLKRKSKHTYRHTPLPYGNDNIASMILKTLSQKNEIYTCSTGDALQYNKCSYCDKVFMNQLYLKSHMTRRHPNVLEIPQRDSEESIQNKSNNTENTKLRDEILDLKIKLKEMEATIKNTTEQVTTNVVTNTVTQNKIENTIDQPKQEPVIKHMKDAEVATNNDDYLLGKIEEWKKEEQEKYHKEINLLRTQIMDSIKTFKEKEATPPSPNVELKIVDQLNTTISKQGAEILTLKQELHNSRLKIEKEDAEKRKENEAQMMLWTSRAEAHAKQYESLLQKLNEVAKEARQSQAQAEAERKRVAQLEDMLQQSLSNKTVLEKNDSHTTQPIPNGDPKNHGTDIQRKEDRTPSKKKSLPKTFPAADRQTLEKLHQKAQALLNMGSLSSSSTDSIEEIDRSPKSRPSLKDINNSKYQNHKSTEIRKIGKEANHIQPNKHVNHDSHNINKNNKSEKKLKGKKPQSKSKSQPQSIANGVKTEKNGPILTPGSPMKILRARITEEVNNRLISAGVDPLKSTLPKFDYQKQKIQIQQQIELKAKKNPSHEKVRHSILALLDSSIPKKVTTPPQDYISPNKISKAFSLTSVISNVKSKALSLVKSNDTNTKEKRKSLDEEVAKRVMSMLSTPPDSTTTSPASKHNHITKEAQLESKSEPKHASTPDKKYGPVPVVNKNKNRTTNPKGHSSVTSTDSENDSHESDHKYYKAVVQQSTKSIENLIKSPARRPLSANSDYNHAVKKYTISDDNLLRSQSVTNISNTNNDVIIENETKNTQKLDNSDLESSENIPDEVPLTNDNIAHNTKQTKGVLKNASSTSSLNKKKVLFDMDAIQMKSLSASPSQSLTEKSDGNEKYELGLINLDGEEWDISSIENEPLKNDTKLQINTRTSPKIAELKQTIESQLARRNGTPPTAIVGGIDVLAPTPLLRASSIAGSNTSLGSSILDDSESLPPVVNNKAFVKPKTITHKDDSELDLSEFSTDGLINNKNEHDAF